MDKLPDPVVYAVPAFILLLIAEMLISLRADKSRYEARDTLTSLMLGTISQVAGAAVGAVVLGMAVYGVAAERLGILPIRALIAAARTRAMWESE